MANQGTTTRRGLSDSCCAAVGEIMDRKATSQAQVEAQSALGIEPGYVVGQAIASTLLGYPHLFPGVRRAIESRPDLAAEVTKLQAGDWSVFDHDAGT